MRVHRLGVERTELIAGLEATFGVERSSGHDRARKDD